jgi:hypothetical protein
MPAVTSIGYIAEHSKVKDWIRSKAGGGARLHIKSKGDTLVLWGDIIHVAAVQFEDPSITIAYDSDKEEAAKVRQQILEEVVKNNWLIGGAHIAFPGIGHVQANGGGYSFVPGSGAKILH